MVDRRSVMMAALALPGLARAQGAMSWRLWPGLPPGGGGPSGPEQIDHRGAIRNIAVPRLHIVTPARPNGAAMLVAAGGGYSQIEQRLEALPAARWLTARGITACLLTYRLPPEGWAAGPLAPLQDAQRAIRLIRANAGALGLDPARLGLLGFSAGGHLLGMTACRPDFWSYQPVDEADRQPANVRAAALAYPVITLRPPYDHTGTRRALVGEHPTLQAEIDWSVETYVTKTCPPLFLVQALDDPISDPQNTVIMDQVSVRAGVPVEFHQLASGGHGFAMGHPGSPTAQWPGWLQGWLGRWGLG